ncbi:ThuA domain-containing protein [Roseibacillus persicicus]|uniref:ThuA domain-containing protein n=1 Tax=Roseibacillus persicicus TaxID=454148 RepID=UPI00280F9743|nr:ThuA domain-containing protein [Roseibacillus persicicus]MDQ8191520.1 ThuA domain-containing protein [Roseibacillus persicicus]
MKITRISLLLTLPSLFLPLQAQTVDWNPSHDEPAPKESSLSAIENALPDQPIVEPTTKRRLLVYSATSGFRHGCIPVGKVALERLGESTGAYEAVVSDDLKNFEPEALQTFDTVLMFNTTGDVFMPNAKSHRKKFSDEQWKQLQEQNDRLVENLVSYVEQGGGLAGIHAATDSCKGNHRYTETIGGVFDGHPWNARSNVTIVVEDPEHAVIKPVFEGMEQFQIQDEIYQFAEGTATRDKLRILLNLDPEQSDKPKGKPKREKGDLPVSWVQSVGKGRVFYSSLGHNDEVYWNPLVLKHYLAGLQFALGDLKADTTPSAEIDLPNLPKK